jgi:OOP family OmpA-OmpF porin
MIPADRARAEAAVSRLPEGYTVQAEIGVLDDGAPFELLLSFDGQVVTASGKVPAGYQLANLRGASLVNDAASSVLPDPDGGFSANAAAGAAALSALLQGSALGIELTGVVQSTADDVAIAAALGAAAQGADINTSLSYLDDGSTNGWRFDYSVTGGGSVAGTLPRGTSTAGLAALVGLGEVSGRPAVGSAADPDADTGPEDASKLLDGLAMAAEDLAESETLSFSTAGDRATLDIVLSHGVDVDLVAADLAQRLPVTLAFTLGTAEALPAEGATRMNSATGQREAFRFGNWLPVLSFVPEQDICRDRAQDVLESGGVNFLSASSQLDAKSIRAINTLSVIVRRCVEEGGLSVEVRGHTDATGGAASNQQLSEERAVAVRDALVARGVDAAAIAALGYGQTRQVSDNATEEGRAANRRIEIIWLE